MRLFVRCFVLGVALAVGGCGGSSSSGGDGTDPAKLIPPDAKVYIEGVVRPEGDAEDRMTAFAGKILRTDDPGAKIQGLLDDSIKEEDPDSSYEKDIEPWLGEHIGAGFSNFAADEPAFVVAIQARDTDAAHDEVEKLAKSNNADKATYKEVEYFKDSDAVVGVVEDAIVISGDEAQFKRAVDASKGASLAEAKAFQDALDTLPDDRVGTLFFDPRGLADAALADADPEGAAVLKPLFAAAKPAAAALLVDEDTAAIEAKTRKPAENAAGSVFGAQTLGSSSLVREVPAGSWAALGVPDLGQVAKSAVNAFAGAIGGAVVAQQAQQLGLDLENDVYGWMGDVAFFVRGDSPASNLDGGLLIEVKDKAKAEQALPKLIGLAQSQGQIPLRPVQVDGASMAFQVAIPDTPVTVIVALGEDRAVIAAGAAAARDALSGSETIEDTGLYARAKDAADGIDPAGIVDGPGLVKLIAGFAGADEGFAEAKAYLDLLDVVSFGSEEDGDQVRSRFALKLR